MHIRAKNLHLVALAACIAGTANAAPKPQTPLVQPTTFECNFDPNSSWDDSNTNAPNPAGAKYGGDLDGTFDYHWVCTVAGDPPVVTEGDGSFTYDVDLSNDGSSLYSYACEGVAPTAVCYGTLDGDAYWTNINDLAAAEFADHCPAGDTTGSSLTGATITAGVKAMIPGRNRGPQNYPQLNCTVPVE
jgi:hypothetical protein